MYCGLKGGGQGLETSEAPQHSTSAVDAPSSAPVLRHLRRHAKAAPCSQICRRMERFWRSPRPTARCGHSVRAVGVGHATALGDDEEEDDSRLTTGDGRMKDDGGAWQMMTDDDG